MSDLILHATTGIDFLTLSSEADHIRLDWTLGPDVTGVTLRVAKAASAKMLMDGDRFADVAATDGVSTEVREIGRVDSYIYAIFHGDRHFHFRFWVEATTEA